MHARIAAGRRVSLEECKNVIVKLANKNNEDISKCIIGAKALLGDEAVQPFEEKFKAYVEYLKTRVDDIAKELKDILKNTKHAHVYIFRLNIWCTYKLDGERKMKTFIGSAVEVDDTINLDEDSISEYELKADVGTNISKGMTISAVCKLIGLYYEQMSSFIRSVHNQLGLDKLEAVIMKNDAFINDAIKHIDEIASSIMSFAKEHEFTSINISNFEITIRSIEDEAEGVSSKLYPVVKADDAE